MEHQQTAESSRPTITREAFLARFSQVASGLDPDQVYALFLKVMARVEQVEQQAKRASAPFVMEATLREAATLCARATEASERAYGEIVQAAEQQAESLLVDARRRTDAIVRAAEDEAAAARARAEQEARAVVEQATREAAELRRSAAEAARMAQSVLDEARSFAVEPGPDPLADRAALGRPAIPPERAPRVAPLVGPGDDWLHAEPPEPRLIGSRPAAPDPLDDLLSRYAASPAPTHAPSPQPGSAAASPEPECRAGQRGPFKLPEWLEA